ncbi:pyridoxamine 5'-phosphate oxidase [Streptomyces sp. NBRC 110611]|uniref:pyridoxamine 5'-phosphate oxidase n=1 Tax=Streptomyces sp. NBRC 110611 TaxID=1621259 RepID=UPI00082AA43F|nr:pyridoxamine 5'-phosphate oxidase [Streptomyces sp. NBRC 110611]GAU68894.1 pyridoxamine 5'-phosphate oxidase [Streptomyces sp. NBRC 110611]
MAKPLKVPDSVRRALAAHTTMTLAYVDADGPQACAVLYATGAMGVAEGTEGADVTEGAGGGGGGEHGAGGVTTGPGGVAPGPQCAPRLYFVTAVTTRHGRALAGPGGAGGPGGARVAFTAQRDGQEWSGLTGLQGRGRCRVLTGAERAVGWRVYTERFPFVEASDQLRTALERTTLWELRPDWLRLIDNGKGFGHKEEWQRTAD